MEPFREASGDGLEPGWGRFHKAAMLIGLWLLVIFLGAPFAQKLKDVVLPLLWAFFCLMILLPCVDVCEQILRRPKAAAAWAWAWCTERWRDARLRVSTCCACLPWPRRTAAAATEPPGAAELRTGLAREGLQGPPGAEPVDVPPAADPAEAEEETNGQQPWFCYRGAAVLIVFMLAISIMAIVAAQIIASAEDVQDDWPHYVNGSQEFVEDVKNRFHSLDRLVSNKTLDNVTKSFLDGLKNEVSSLVEPILTGLAGILMQILMFLLYVGFWLSQPIEINAGVANLFKKYILLKSLVSVLYGLSTWGLLLLLGVQLSFVFGMLTALCNFIPEVGPLIAGLLPVPIIIFDDRMWTPTPWSRLLFTLGGELALKFFFGNIVEVVLIDKHEDMRLHPVVILFMVAFWGWVWGPTGMLISVPFVAVVKNTAQAWPSPYRRAARHVLQGEVIRTFRAPDAH